jgi:signal transduction histidine kinase
VILLNVSNLDKSILNPTKLKNQFPVTRYTRDVEEKAILLQAFFKSVQQYQVLLNRRLEIVAFNDCALSFHQTNGCLYLEKGRSILNYINTSFVKDFKTQCNKALQGEPVEYEHFINGGWFNFTISALYNPDDEIAGLSIVGSDINNQKKTERIIRQQSESLSAIAQFQSHQLRHPVSIILGFVNLIKEEDYILKKEYLHAVEKATNQLDEIIRAIVKESRTAK